ncbi:glucosaminidase domain-containing protein [Aneurinibacillus migulanus]|uniref:glucosaminidase domain-containing protein n=1 Tax=Aneurinibacillus migulanus TaxID=47500 RepID=UPI002E21B0D0|nr:glucosaminidase domain-containing protein [Aneurinibacillus migulanus]MED4727212.1 glucosaminidase domain-containing protein [Aneurinibacillus migulanus]
MTQNEFIEAIGQAAQTDMKRTGILASLTVAQACLESNWGNSGLAIKGKNLFGVKGKGPAGSITMPTYEWERGQKIKINAAFRKYNTWAESIADRSALFLRLPRYKNLIGEKDYKRACQKVQQDGYATDPQYATKLISMIEKYKLYRFDQASASGGTTSSTTLRLNSRSDAVKSLQEKLNKLGFSVGAADGIFGRKTEEALRAFQKANNPPLAIDGICGPATKALLEKNVTVSKPGTAVGTMTDSKEPTCRIVVNGAKLDAPGIIRDNLSYLPVRAMGNAVGVAVGFCNGKATLGKGTLETTIVIGETGYAQSREIAEVLGYILEWKQATREVIFTKGKRY